MLVKDYTEDPPDLGLHFHGGACQGAIKVRGWRMTDWLRIKWTYCDSVEFLLRDCFQHEVLIIWMVGLRDLLQSIGDEREIIAHLGFLYNVKLREGEGAL